jgi:MFS family permease
MTIGREFRTGVAALQWVASAACGFAPDAGPLIITRVLQGAGAALLTPESLAILEASFRPADRARAIGTWSGLGGIAVAAGPLIGGFLISAASWRWIFFINIPIDSKGCRWLSPEVSLALVVRLVRRWRCLPW